MGVTKRRPTSFHLTDVEKDDIDHLVKCKLYLTRAEAMRAILTTGMDVIYQKFGIDRPTNEKVKNCLLRRQNSEN